VRTSVFRPKRGGYDEDDVDDYLDRVVDLLLRREQLREADRRWSEPPAEPAAQRQGRRPIDGPLFRPAAAAREGSGHGTGGYEQPGYDRRGYPMGGYDPPRYDQPRYDQPRYDQPRYDQSGHPTGDGDGQWGDDQRPYGSDWSAGGATR
jgi:DivIVA domain-containing protein